MLVHLPMLRCEPCDKKDKRKYIKKEMKESVLDRVTVNFRCPMKWEEMAGNEGEKFCNQCRKSVTDLSQMTSEEAEGFIREQGPLGQACVRFFRDKEGKMVTKGCGAPAVVGMKVARTMAAGAAAAGSLAMAACSSNQEPIEVLGGLGCPTFEK